jgi:hypothetical protein
VLHRGTKIPLPGAKADDFEDYCRAVVAADPKPTPVEKLLHDREQRK